MEAGDAHKMGVEQVNNPEAEFPAPGPAGGGKVVLIDPHGGGVQFRDGINKIRRQGCALLSVTGTEKSRDADPERDKIQVDPDKAGIKGDPFIQFMLRPGYGYSAGKEGGTELKEEKIFQDNQNTAKAPAQKQGMDKYLQYGKGHPLVIHSVLFHSTA
jgi:hypothetical protein